VQMIKCRACGAANSVKRAKCCECEADLHGPAPPRGADQLRVCKNCIHSTVFPPAGTTIGYTSVWCLRLETVKEADDAAGDCFEVSFTWRREESLD
jgi:hypothetical protein